MSSQALHVLCAGACRPLFLEMQPWLTRIPLQADFGPVGRLSDWLRAGRAADVLLSSRRALGVLVREGYVDEHSIQPVGRVATAIAIPAEASGPTLSHVPDDAVQFAHALLTIEHLYLPDTRRATAGIHMFGLFESLGVAEALRSRLHELPNGAAAIAAMIQDGFASALGFAQQTEIIATPGTVLIGGLPQGHELITEYCSALVLKPTLHPKAQVFVSLFREHASPGLRHSLGFLDPTP